ncbi:Luciferase-like monooxygenase [Sphingobium faniae]|nr:Luciferase-like monooxygenase [Sphingobium faniae]
MVRLAKAGVYNMGWSNWDEAVALGVEAEKGGDKVQFFTDLMVRYLFKETGEKIFGKEKLAPSPFPGILSNGVQAVPYGPELMGVTDPLLVMGAVGAQTSTMEMLLGAIDCVRHAPQKLLQSFLTLDHITKGRGIYALGGSEIKQLTPYGFSRIGSAKKLEEAIQIIRLLLEAEGGPVHFQGEHWKMKGGSMPIRPYGDKPPKIICAPGVSNEIMGRYSDGMLTNTKRHPGGLEGFRRDVAIMRESAAKAGRNPDDLIVSACPQIIMHDDPAKVQELANSRELKFVTMMTGKERGYMWKDYGFEHPLGDEFGYARKQRPEDADPEVINAAIEKVPAEAVTQIGFHAGSVQQIIDELSAWVEAGLDYIGIVDYGLWVDHDIAPAAAENHRKLVDALQKVEVKHPKVALEDA